MEEVIIVEGLEVAAVTHILEEMVLNLEVEDVIEVHMPMVEMVVYGVEAEVELALDMVEMVVTEAQKANP